MNKDTLLLVDYHNTLIRSISVNKHLWGPNDEFTGGVYGVFTQLMTAFRTFKTYRSFGMYRC